MAFKPYARFQPRPYMEEIRPHRSLSMLETVFRSFTRRPKSHVGFKIIPEERLPNQLVQLMQPSAGWGIQLMFTGGQLGAIVAPDLARKAPQGAVYFVSWELPRMDDDEEKVLELHSVYVRSRGDAESFPPDLLMAELAPDLAEETRGAHVFHFYEERSAQLFQYLLGCEIDAFSSRAEQ
jgi:hypothetical protein